MANRNTRTSTPTQPTLVLSSNIAAALQHNTSTVQAVPGALATNAMVVAPLAVQPAAPTHSSPYKGHITQQLVALAKPYNVRAGTACDNVRSWQAIQAYLAANGGQATVGAIAAHLGQLYNHASMAQYCVRRGYLGPVQAS